MANIKISELPAASAASASQEFETNDSGTSKKVTGSQLKSFVKSGLAVADVTDLTATATELNYVDGVTSAIQTQLNGKFTQRTITGTADQITVTNGDGVSGNPTIAAVVASKAEAEAGTNATKLMTPQRVRDAFNATGSTPLYACRAWVNFNGTGTVAIRASGNVSSVTDGGVGRYTVNFAEAMPDANYAVNAFAKRSDDVVNIAAVTARASGVYSTTAVEISTLIPSWSLADFPTICVAIFR